MSRRAAQRGGAVGAVGVTAKGDTPVARTEGFRTYCVLLGFDLVAFDAWLAALPACPIKNGLSERREQAFQAMIRNEQSTALWHLEFLNERWRQARREAFLVPLARKAKDRIGQIKGFSDAGARARRSYTEADREKWRVEAAELQRRRAASKQDPLAKRALAQQIIVNLRLSQEAFESIRKAI